MAVVPVGCTGRRRYDPSTRGDLGQNHFFCKDQLVEDPGKEPLIKIGLTKWVANQIFSNLTGASPGFLAYIGENLDESLSLVWNHIMAAASASPTNAARRRISVQRKKVGSTSTTLNYITVRSTQLTKLGCQKCRSVLDVFQPSVNHPYQFLAVCATCGAWFRVEIQPGDSQGVMISLPEVANLLPNGGSIPNPTA